MGSIQVFVGRAGQNPGTSAACSEKYPSWRPVHRKFGAFVCKETQPIGVNAFDSPIIERMIDNGGEAIAMKRP